MPPVRFEEKNTCRKKENNNNNNNNVTYDEENLNTLINNIKDDEEEASNKNNNNNTSLFSGQEVELINTSDKVDDNIDSKNLSSDNKVVVTSKRHEKRLKFVDQVIEQLLKQNNDTNNKLIKVENDVKVVKQNNKNSFYYLPTINESDGLMNISNHSNNNKNHNYKKIATVSDETPIRQVLNDSNLVHQLENNGMNDNNNEIFTYTECNINNSNSEDSIFIRKNNQKYKKFNEIKTTHDTSKKSINVTKHRNTKNKMKPEGYHQHVGAIWYNRSSSSNINTCLTTNTIGNNNTINDSFYDLDKRIEAKARRDILSTLSADTTTESSPSCKLGNNLWNLQEQYNNSRSKNSNKIKTQNKKDQKSNTTTSKSIIKKNEKNSCIKIQNMLIDMESNISRKINQFGKIETESPKNALQNRLFDLENNVQNKILQCNIVNPNATNIDGEQPTNKNNIDNNSFDSIKKKPSNLCRISTQLEILERRILSTNKTRMLAAWNNINNNTYSHLGTTSNHNHDDTSDDNNNSIFQNDEISITFSKDNEVPTSINDAHNNSTLVDNDVPNYFHLAIATPIVSNISNEFDSPNINENIPLAVEYDPTEQISKEVEKKYLQYKCKNKTLIGVILINFCICTTVVVALLYGFHKPKVSEPLGLDKLGIRDFIASQLDISESSLLLSHNTNTTNSNNAYVNALNWILYDDLAQLLPSVSSNLLQRYILGYYYYATSYNTELKQLSSWSYCGPIDDNNTMEYSSCPPPQNYFTPQSMDDIPVTYRQTQQRWLSEHNECLWLGVVCNTQGQVTKIELSSLNMTSIGFPEGILKYLPFISEYASTYGNRLSGTIPGSLIKTHSKHLINFQIQGNQYYGDFPESIFLSRNLQSVRIHSNNFTGTLPKALYMLKDLKHFYVGENYFIGSLPTTIGLSNSLTMLNLQHNDFTGTIPTELGKLKLQLCHFENNKFHGSIPTEFGLITTLQDISLANNNFTGSIPLDFYNLIMLNKLQLQDNMLTGTVSTEIGKLISLRQLQLKGNNFHGTLPTELGNVAELVYATFSDNDFSGDIPFPLCQLELETLEADCIAVDYQQPKQGSFLAANAAIGVYCPAGCCTKCM